MMLKWTCGKEDRPSRWIKDRQTVINHACVRNGCHFLGSLMKREEGCVKGFFHWQSFQLHLFPTKGFLGHAHNGGMIAVEALLYIVVCGLFSSKQFFKALEVISLLLV